MALYKNTKRPVKPYLDFSQLTQEGHFGLAGMKERAEGMDGSFLMLANPGQGTVLQVTGPLRGKNIKVMD